ncbi:MAG: hypothetical protein JEZ05_01905 [Tenericutes bacterium]|nr:hypothetical protein [Mycoplasmatota bacterium]
MGWYYLQSRYYNPESCRFINNDVIIGEFASGNSNIFSYTTNNPVNYADSTGYARYKNIGVGVQIAFSVSISWVSFSGGFELVWYTSQQVKVGRASRYVPHVYGYVEAGLEYLYNGMGVIDKLIESLTKTASNPKVYSAGISLSGFEIRGNKKFTLPNHYSEGFNTRTINFGYGKTYYSWSKYCKVYGAGVYLWGYSLGISRSKSYYYYLGTATSMIRTLMGVLGISTSKPSV